MQGTSYEEYAMENKILDKNITIPVALHLDHGSSVENCKKALDAGFTCPNRDGTISDEGCIFCDGGGSF